jgi:hypothetical protein
VLHRKKKDKEKKCTIIDPNQNSLGSASRRASTERRKTKENYMCTVEQSQKQLIMTKFLQIIDPYWIMSPVFILETEIISSFSILKPYKKEWKEM